MAAAPTQNRTVDAVACEYAVPISGRLPAFCPSSYVDLACNPKYEPRAIATSPAPAAPTAIVCREPQVRGARPGTAEVAVPGSGLGSSGRASSTGTTTEMAPGLSTTETDVVHGFLPGALALSSWTP